MNHQFMYGHGAAQGYVGGHMGGGTVQQQQPAPAHASDRDSVHATSGIHAGEGNSDLLERGHIAASATIDGLDGAAWSPIQAYPVVAAFGSRGGGAGFESSVGKLKLVKVGFNASVGSIQSNYEHEANSFQTVGETGVPADVHALAWSHGVPLDVHIDAELGMLAVGGANGVVAAYDAASIVGHMGKSPLHPLACTGRGKSAAGVTRMKFNPLKQGHLLAVGRCDGGVSVVSLAKSSPAVAELKDTDGVSPLPPGTPGQQYNQLESVTCVEWNTEVAHILATSHADSPTGGYSAVQATTAYTFMQSVVAPASTSPSLVVWDLMKSGPFCRLSRPGITSMHGGARGYAGLGWSSYYPLVLLAAAYGGAGGTDLGGRGGALFGRQAVNYQYYQYYANRLAEVHVWDLRAFQNGPVQILNWPNGQTSSPFDTDILSIEWRGGMCDANTMISTSQICKEGHEVDDIVLVWDLGKAEVAAKLPLPASAPPDTPQGAPRGGLPPTVGLTHALARGTAKAADFFGSSGGALVGVHEAVHTISQPSSSAVSPKPRSGGRVQSILSEQVPGGLALIVRGDSVGAVPLANVLPSRPHYVLRRVSRVAWGAGSRLAATLQASSREVSVQAVRTVSDASLAAVTEFAAAIRLGSESIIALLQHVSQLDATGKHTASGQFSDECIDLVLSCIRPSHGLSSTPSDVRTALQVAVAALQCYADPTQFPQLILGAIGLGHDALASDTASISRRTGILGSLGEYIHGNAVGADTELQGASNSGNLIYSSEAPKSESGNLGLGGLAAGGMSAADLFSTGVSSTAFGSSGGSYTLGTSTSSPHIANGHESSESAPNEPRVHKEASTTLSLVTHGSVAGTQPPSWGHALPDFPLQTMGENMLSAQDRLKCEHVAQACLLTGDFRGAVVSILAAGGAARAAEALWIAAHASDRDAELLQDTVSLVAQGAHDASTGAPCGFLGAASALVQGNVAALVHAASAHKLRESSHLWRDTLGAILTFGVNENRGSLLADLKSKCIEASRSEAVAALQILCSGEDTSASESSAGAAAVRWMLKKSLDLSPLHAGSISDEIEAGCVSVCSVAFAMRESGMHAEAKLILEVSLACIVRGNHPHEPSGSAYAIRDALTMMAGPPSDYPPVDFARFAQGITQTHDQPSYPSDGQYFGSAHGIESPAVVAPAADLRAQAGREMFTTSQQLALRKPTNANSAIQYDLQAQIPTSDSLEYSTGPSRPQQSEQPFVAQASRFSSFAGTGGQGQVYYYASSTQNGHASTSGVAARKGGSRRGKVARPPASSAPRAAVPAASTNQIVQIDSRVSSQSNAVGPGTNAAPQSLPFTASGGSLPANDASEIPSAVQRRGRRERASSGRGTVAPDGFRSTAGNPHEAAEYQPVAFGAQGYGFSGAVQSGGDYGGGWGTETTGARPVDESGVARAGVMDSGLPGSSSGSQGGVAASEDDMQLLTYVEAVVGQLRAAVHSPGDQRVCDECLSSVEAIRQQWACGELSASLAEAVRSVLRSVGAYDFATALKAHSAMGRAHWSDVKMWSGAMKSFLRLAGKNIG